MMFSVRKMAYAASLLLQPTALVLLFWFGGMWIEKPKTFGIIVYQFAIYIQG
jgi:hypothetical protein